MGGCLRAMRVMLRGVLRGAAVVLRWCAAWCCVVLRGDGMLGWWMMDVET